MKTNTTFFINGKKRVIAEPVFHQLRIIIPAYNLLGSDCSESKKVTALYTLLIGLLGKDAPLKRISAPELTALLSAIKDICQLKTAIAGSKNSSDNWGEIYAHLSACLGWTYDYIDNHMTMSRLIEYQRYWAENPPTHQLVAAYLGYEQQEKQAGSQFLATIAAQAKAQGLSS